MIRPKEVWLCGQRYRIEWLKHELNDGGDRCNGLLTIETQTIQIHDEGTEVFLKQILMHEITHACWAVNGRRHPDEEEHCCRVLEMPLATLFTDKRNAPFRRWMEKA